MTAALRIPDIACGPTPLSLRSLRPPSEDADVVERQGLRPELILVPLRSSQEVEPLQPLLYRFLDELRDEHEPRSEAGCIRLVGGVVQVEDIVEHEPKRGCDRSVGDLEEVHSQ